MTKSMARKLNDAAELVSALAIARDEMIGCTVDSFSDLSIQLRPPGFARVFQALGVPRKKLQVNISEDGHLHAGFSARGAAWACIVWRKDLEQSPQWREILGETQSRIDGDSLCIEGRAQPARLPAPEVVTL